MYHRGELTSEQHLRIKEIIKNNEVYEAMLDGIEKMEAESNEKEIEEVIDNAQTRFLNKLNQFLVLAIFLCTINPC